MKLQFLTVFLALAAILSGCNKENSSKINPAPATQNSTSAKVETVVAKDTAKDDVKAASKSVSDNWYTYTAKDGTYSAKFPGKPQEQQQTTNSKAGKLNFALSSYEDREKNQAYVTSSTNYPVKPSNFNVEEGLKGYVDGVVAKGTLLSQKKITYKDKGFPGGEITLRNKDGIYARARYYVDPSGPTLYQALVASESENLDSPEATAFLDSLTIK